MSLLAKRYINHEISTLQEKVLLYQEQNTNLKQCIDLLNEKNNKYKEEIRSLNARILENSLNRKQFSSEIKASILKVASC